MARTELLRLIDNGWPDDVKLDREQRFVVVHFPARTYYNVIGGRQYKAKSSAFTVRLLDLDDEWMGQFDEAIGGFKHTPDQG